jgi:hypothetical protein
MNGVLLFCVIIKLLRTSRVGQAYVILMKTLVGSIKSFSVYGAFELLTTQKCVNCIRETMCGECEIS